MLVPMTSISAQEPSSARQLLDKILKATEDNDYTNFVAEGDAAFKAGITPEMVQGVSIQVSPRMKKGYECSYLGELNQRGFKMYLWKLTFKDGGDDVLAKLVVKDGKVSGAWLQ
jgi:hypothetical protein